MIGPEATAGGRPRGDEPAAAAVGPTLGPPERDRKTMRTGESIHYYELVKPVRESSGWGPSTAPEDGTTVPSGTASPVDDDDDEG